MTVNTYVRELLDRYVALPNTPDRPRRSDRALARSLFSDHVPLSLVLDAMLLATVRRHYRDPALPSLEPIHSLHYFLPVIRHLEANPLDPFYVDYLKSKLEGVEHTRNTAHERAMP